MDIKERLVAIGKSIVAYTILAIYAIVCWFLGVRDIKLMLVVFFGGLFVFAMVFIFFSEKRKKKKKIMRDIKEPSIIPERKVLPTRHVMVQVPSEKQQVRDVESLLQDLKNWDSDFRKRAVYALGEIGGTRVVEPS